MATVLNSLFFFIIALGVLITIHEYGHFWVARRCGVKVLRFSVGFGRPLWQRVGKDGVEYVLAMIPLGGYVKMLDEAEGDVPVEDRSKAFNNQPLLKRVLIVAAGPVANLLLAILLYTLVYSVGVDGIRPVIGKVEANSLAAQGNLQTGDEIIAVNGSPVSSWQAAMFALLEQQMDKQAAILTIKESHGLEVQKTLDYSKAEVDSEAPIDALKQAGIRPFYPEIPAVVGELTDARAASQAGFEAGDVIKTMNGLAVIDWLDWVKKVRAKPEQTLLIGIERRGQPQTLELRPERQTSKAGDIGFVGMGPNLESFQQRMQALRVTVRYAVPEALLYATQKTWDMSLLTLQVMGRIVTGEASLSNLSGPLSIAQYAGDTARIGLNAFLMFLAVISISLGVLNLLPIPMLDGGHLFYYLIEFIRGKPVPDWVQDIGMKIGIFILLCLMSVAFYNDILRLFFTGS